MSLNKETIDGLKDIQKLSEITAIVMPVTDSDGKSFTEMCDNIPSDDVPTYGKWIDDALIDYSSAGLRVCYVIWPKAQLRSFVTYPEYQEMPTGDQLLAALKLRYIQHTEEFVEHMEMAARYKHLQVRVKKVCL